MSALDKQIGGSHYKDMAIQPIEYIHKNAWVSAKATSSSTSPAGRPKTASRICGK
jgi:hypothetical protein